MFFSFLCEYFSNAVIFLVHHGSNLHDPMQGKHRIAQQPLLVPSLVPEISSSGSKVLITFGGKGAIVRAS